MFCLYILKSKKFSTYYIGVSSNIKKRLEKHNKGMVKSTKYKRPWVLIYKESFTNLGDARRRELQLKSLKKREALEKIIKHF